MRNTEYLVLFFRNLLLGETNELKNRYMLINAPDNWEDKETRQAPDKYPTSSP